MGRPSESTPASRKAGRSVAPVDRRVPAAVPPPGPREAGAPLSLRDRKRAEAKAKVADVAIELFAERGFAEVSVAEICAAAEVAPRSFFRYFPAKAEVLLEPVQEMALQIDAAIAAAPAELDDEQALRFGLRQLAEYMLEHWPRLTAFFRVVAETEAVHASPLVRLADRERSVVEHLLARRPEPPRDDWRTRLLVAQAVAAFRVWLEEVRTAEVADPLGLFDEVVVG